MVTLPESTLLHLGRQLRAEYKSFTDEIIPSDWLKTLGTWAIKDIIKEYDDGKRRDVRFHW